jgi:SAM-dependent methyltransferase
MEYPIHESVVCFVKPDNFYESRYDAATIHFVPDENSFIHLLLLYLLSQHYFWFIRKYFSNPGTILDVACGAGACYLATKGNVAGLDLSFTSIRQTTLIYDCSVQASAFAMPFPDGSFDYLACKFFLEHVPLEAKGLLLSEFRRVLRPGGRMVIVQGCDCENPLFRWAKRNTELYRRHFIEHDGHVGLIRASENLELIKKNGFQILDYYACGRTCLLHLPMLEWLRPFVEKSRLFSIILGAVSYIARHKWLNWAYTAGVTLFDDAIGHFFPLDNAAILLMACEKSAGNENLSNRKAVS